VIRVQSAAGAAGFRQVLEINDLLYGLNDDPDSVFVLDLSGLEDDAFSDILYDTQVGGLTTARDLTSDEGLENTASIGPGQMALDATRETLFVTNFNDNSVSVFDLSLGIHGQLVHTISMVGENPYAIAIHPDGDHAVVGNFTGEMDDEKVSHSTLAVIDIDPDSASYLEVLTWIVND
jgi:DNA-binding beta-propeller fold protein YncE